MSYIKGTNLEALIDRAVDGWAKILGFTDKKEEPKPKPKPKPKSKKKTNKQLYTESGVVNKSDLKD